MITGTDSTHGSAMQVAYRQALVAVHCIK